MSVETYGVEQLLRDLREYTCPVHGCEASLSSGSLLCRGHWRLVHADLKREVFEVVRKIERIAKRYDTAMDGSPRQAKLADEWLAAEIVCREVQLRAVIVASERAGARPDVVGSAPSTTPGKGGCMKIKTAVNSDGCATVALCDADGTPVETRTIEPGQELETSLATVTDPQQVSVGEVCETGAATSESEARDATGGESAAADTGGEGGETADAGETAGGEGAGKDCGEGEGEAPTP